MCTASVKILKVFTQTSLMSVMCKVQNMLKRLLTIFWIEFCILSSHAGVTVVALYNITNKKKAADVTTGRISSCSMAVVMPFKNTRAIVLVYK